MSDSAAQRGSTRFITPIADESMPQNPATKSDIYRRLIDTMPGGLIVVDTRGRAIFANPAASCMMGYPYSELVGSSLTVFVSEESLPILQTELTKWLGGMSSQHELVIKRKDGGLRTFFVTGAPLFDNENRIMAVSAVFSDVTEFRRAEAEKLELREKLARAQRMESLGVLAGGVAHDLNNILGPLVAYPELIRMRLPADSPILGQLSKIESSALRAVEVVQDLLTLARRGRYEMAPLDLNRVIESYLQSPDHDNLRLRFPAVEVTTELSPDAMPVYGSLRHLHKVVMNLVLNAMEAMPRGGTLHIKTETGFIDRLVSGYDNIECGIYTIFTVGDTGVGIDPKDYKRLFEPFYTRKEMGLRGRGLGLAVVYGVVKDHNGYIDVRSRPGEGSEFILYFPATMDQAKSEIGGVNDIRGAESILVVDDVLEQRELAATVLGSLGYRVHMAADGHDAIEFLKTNSVDVVILDMIMKPEFDGLDTYMGIIELHPGQKVIITSGFSESERIREAESLGVNKYIRKPYTMQKLGKAIREVLGPRAKATS